MRAPVSDGELEDLFDGATPVVARCPTTAN
jgi:hypothetical protein